MFSSLGDAMLFWLRLVNGIHLCMMQNRTLRCRIITDGPSVSWNCAVSRPDTKGHGPFHRIIPAGAHRLITRTVCWWVAHYLNHQGQEERQCIGEYAGKRQEA